MSGSPVAQTEEVADLATRALGGTSAWLQVIDGPVPADAIVVSDLTLDGGRLLDRQLDTWQVSPDDPAEFRAGIVGTVAWMLLAPVVAMIGEHRVRPAVDLAKVPMRFAGIGDHDDEVARVWWPADTILVPVIDLEASLRSLIDETVAVLAPLVEAVRSRTPVGRRGLWGRVVDAFATLGPGYEHVEFERRRDDLAAFRRSAAGTVLDQRIEVIEFDRPDGARCMSRTVACCFAYKSPTAHDEHGRPWDGGAWAGYCMSCPLIPVSETVARANYWIDHG